MNDTNESNKPSHYIFQVIGEDSNAIWIRVGAAWNHGDGKGARLVLNSMPLTGRMVMRERTERAEADQFAQDGGSQ